MEEQNINDTTNQQIQNSTVTLEEMNLQINKAKKKGRVQGVWISIIIVLLIVLAAFVIKISKWISEGTIYGHILGTLGGHVVNSEVIDKADELYNLIDAIYLEDIDKDKLREGIYKGLLEGLEDPYSVYYDKEEFAELMEDSTGVFEGIGAMLQQDPDTKKIKVVRPIKNSPAKEAGILAEDVLVSVDGENISGQDINVVVSKIRGPKGSSVEIGVRRNGKKNIITYDIVRDEVVSESVEYEMKENQIGYIMITEFAEQTGKQFKQALSALQKQNMQSLIVDLRSNGGGSVATSVEIADMFVKEGVIVSIKDKNGMNNVYEDKGDENYLTIPCVLLVDGNTASASEILTGCLMDYGIATVIGTQTFGKGIAQDVIPLDDNTGVKITSAKYYSPKGINIHGVGFEPDIVVEWDYEKYTEDGTDNQIEAAINYLEYGNVEGK